MDKVTGRARYVDDIDLPGALHGVTVRSAVPCGILRAVELDPAFNWSGVTVITAADIPGKNAVYLYEEDQPALVAIGSMVRHREEPVALIAAPTRAHAEAARRHMRIKIEERPAIFDMERPITRSEAWYGDDNVYQRFEIVHGDVEAALATADLVIDDTYRTPAQEHMYIEPQGMAAYFEGRTCHVIGSLQCPFYVHKALTVLLGLQDEEVVVTQAVTGGAFGGKEEYPNLIAGHAALLARKAKKPVKMIYDREEDIAATTKRHPAIIHHRLGVRKDGALVAADVDVILDGGAYLTLSKVVLSRAVLHAAGPYRYQAVRIRGRVVATNHPPHGAFRGFGAPQTTFAYERQVARAARKLKIDPFVMREKNMLRLGDKTATQQVLENSVASEKVLLEVKRAAARKSLGPHLEGKRRRGRGLCFYFHGAGFTGSGEARLASRARVSLEKSGRFAVETSQTDMGQGALTTFAQIAAAVLEVPVSEVSVPEPDTSKVPNSGPTVASRTCMVVGGVVEKAARALKANIMSWSDEHDVNGTLMERAQKMAQAVGAVSETVTYQPPAGIAWDDKTYTGAAYAAYGWAACLVDVEVDVVTSEVTVTRCVHAVDVGKAIHPIIVKGQIEGGTLQALGWALWENVLYKDGRVQNRTMTNCIVPTALDAPEMETILCEEPYPHGPHGAKGVGEIPMDGPAAAVADAIADALGVEFRELPISPEQIQRALTEVA
jgi:CO/xanthine dehydrogenase Mo-binding subunit